ncbi:MAG TPA: NAD-dependent epimerase/dehydratase family protein [Candidatus Angelobacter sp.]|jgi:uncharacterized protein YbjT (DUF2867 family)|nr:NAD-dependent epimerase/dehydratase family protein [Candidatus Angelobacter sp.]
MKVLIFGATGMIGQGVLRECLLDNDVESVVSIGRSGIGQHHEKLREILRNDLSNFSDIESELAGLDACFFCLGIASSGMSEEAYNQITYGITLAAAQVLARLNPRMTFVYVSGAGTDTSERGRIMWARVKGKTENALLQLSFAAAYMFRPGLIEPFHGVKSKTRSYRIFYALTKPILPLFRLVFPNYILTTEQIGLAMLAAARKGYKKRVLESKDIRELTRPSSG